MIKEKIQKMLKNKYFGLILAVIINTVFFIVCNKLFTPKYEQVDDFIIMNLISKMDGNYSLYGVQMHPIICGIIILLYKTAININWYTIFMLVMQFISFTIIGTVFINKNKIIGVPLYVSFVFIMYSKMLIYIQYTTVSMLCITAGFILLMYTIEDIEKINRYNLAISILMFLFGCMIRFSTIIIAVPFIAVYFIFKILKEKNLKIIKIALALVISILLVNISFNIFYNINPIYKEFLDFHDVRTYLHDYNWMNYNSNKETFDSVNWSKNDRDIFYAYCFGDEKFYNIENLEELKNNASQNESFSEIKQRLSYLFEDFYDAVKQDIYKYIFYIASLLAICNNISIILNNSKENLNKKDNIIKILCFANFSFLAIISMHCLFIFLNRPMFRVIISIYIIGIVIMSYLLLEKNKFNNKHFIMYILIFIILIFSIKDLKQNIYYAQFYNKDNYSVYKEIVEYTSSNKENAYLYTLVMHDRFLAYSVYEKVPDNSYENLRPLGDWDTYTKNYYDFKERYNIDNLIESIYKNENVYLISGDVIWGEEYKEYINIIEKYIEEHYNVDVESSVVKEFRNNIKIYKIQEK